MPVAPTLFQAESRAPGRHPIKMGMASPTNMKIQIEGMSCDACVARVRRALAKIPDARVKEVSIGSAEFEISPERLDEALRAIEKAGYQPHIPA